ncbi:MAG: SDR family oxidoreductase [Oscillospiraceae bacterium]|nr:SDR family oxidoreductase [Oscillospiraceae bacterium]
MKTALITGASGGIGARIAKELSNAGYAVALTYNKNKSAAEELCAELHNVQAFHCDISSFTSVQQLYADVLSVFGRIDVVVNNAGTAYTGLLQDMTEAEILNIINTDLNGVIYSTKFAADHMVKKHCGNIINISSVWGVAGASCEAVYSAAKGGVIAFTKAMAKELAPSGIRVNCISPGVIKTPMLDCYSADDLQALADETPLGRIGTTDDVAKAVKFLISDDASFITGQNLIVDGGFIL